MLYKKSLGPDEGIAGDVSKLKAETRILEYL